MDPFGFALLATVTGVGGGTLRDLLIGAGPVFWVGDPRDVLVCLMVGGSHVFAWAHGGSPSRWRRRGRALLWADALGLPFSPSSEPARRWTAGVPALSAIALGTITATFGGIIRDSSPE